MYIDFMSHEALLGLGEGLKKNRGLLTLNVMMWGKGPGVGAWQQFVLCLKENRHLTKLITAVRREIAIVNETRRQELL